MAFRMMMVALAAALWACGGLLPEAGDSCTDSAGCQDDQTGLFCEGGVLRAIPCKGAFGCTVEDRLMTCDVKPEANDACSAQHEGQGGCDSANADQAFVCRSGAWTAEPCAGCAIDGTRVVCLP